MTKNHSRFSCHILFGLAAILSSNYAWAQSPPEAAPIKLPDAESHFLVRLNAQGGRATQDGRVDDSEFGADLLLSANDFQRYGLHISSLTLNSTPAKQRYICTGYVLETVVFHWLRAEIGTVGFIGRGEASGKNPFGILASLGYEKRVGRMNFSVGYDSKVIFTKPAITTNNLAINFGVHF
jgi:hypothetical protein